MRLRSPPSPLRDVSKRSEKEVDSRPNRDEIGGYYSLYPSPFQSPDATTEASNQDIDLAAWMTTHRTPLDGLPHSGRRTPPPKCALPAQAIAPWGVNPILPRRCLLACAPQFRQASRKSILACLTALALNPILPRKSGNERSVRAGCCRVTPPAQAWAVVCFAAI